MARKGKKARRKGRTARKKTGKGRNLEFAVLELQGEIFFPEGLHRSVIIFGVHRRCRCLCRQCQLQGREGGEIIKPIVRTGCCFQILLSCRHRRCRLPLSLPPPSRAKQQRESPWSDSWM
jgi:hypothetical protein